jgi:hypothetical protein
MYRIFYPPSPFVLDFVVVVIRLSLRVFKSVCPCHSNRPAVVVTALAGGKSLAAAVVAWRLPVPIGCNVSTCLAQWARDRQLSVRRSDQLKCRCWNAVAVAPTS